MSQVKNLTLSTYYTFVALNNILMYVKTSLRRRCRKALFTDWLRYEEAWKFPFREYYVGLKKIRHPLRDTSKELERIHDILEIEVKDGGAINVALIG